MTGIGVNTKKSCGYPKASSSFCVIMKIENGKNKNYKQNY